MSIQTPIPITKPEGTPDIDEGEPEFIHHPSPWQQLARINNVLCDDGKRRNAQITGEALTYDSVPARVSYRGTRVRGFVYSSKGRGGKRDELFSCRPSTVIPRRMQECSNRYNDNCLVRYIEPSNENVGICWNCRQDVRDRIATAEGTWHIFHDYLDDNGMEFIISQKTLAFLDKIASEEHAASITRNEHIRTLLRNIHMDNIINECIRAICHPDYRGATKDEMNKWADRLMITLPYVNIPGNILTVDTMHDIVRGPLTAWGEYEDRRK